MEESLIRSWVTPYNQFGYAVLTKSMTKAHYFGDFKRVVLQYRHKNQLPYREATIHFGIKSYSTMPIGNVSC